MSKEAESYVGENPVLDAEEIRRSRITKTALRLAASAAGHGTVFGMYLGGTAALTAIGIKSGVFEDVDARGTALAFGLTLTLNYYTLFRYSIQNLRLVKEDKVKTSPHFGLTAVSYLMNRFAPSRQGFGDGLAVAAAVVPSMPKDAVLFGTAFGSNEVLAAAVAANACGAIVNSLLERGGRAALKRVNARQDQA